MTDVVEKQVKQMLEKLMAEVKKTAGGVNTGTKQMQQSFSNMATTMVSATKVTSTWSGDMLENIQQVVRGHTKLNESVTQVWKNGQLTRVTKVDSDPISEANRLYKRQTELLSEIKKKRIELTKQQAGTIGYRELEKEVVAREREYAANARLIAQLPQEIQDRTKLNTLLEKQRDVTREIGRAQTEAREKKNETAQIEHANQLYEMQKNDLQELADLTKKYYASLGTAEADDYRELIEILEGVIALRKEEIDQVDAQIAAHSRLKHLNKEYKAAEGSIENTQIEHANGLYAKQRQNLEDLVTAYRAYLNAKSDEEKAGNAEWFSSVADRVEETQKEIDLLDVQIAKNSD